MAGRNDRKKQWPIKPEPKATAGGLVGFAGDVGRSTTSLLDLIASMTIDTANEASKGLYGLYGTTPLRNFGGRYPLNPEQDDVSRYMEGAPQLPNPFPMTEGGESRMRSIGEAASKAINSKFGRKAQEVESKLEDIANRYFGPEAAGTVFATTLGIAGTFDPIPGTTPKIKGALDVPVQPKKPTALTKADRQRLDKLAEKYPDIRPLMRFLTPDEQRALNGQNVGGVLEAWGELDPSEMASVAMAGRAKRGWYEKSSKALNELFGEEDAPRFAALLASLSPQTSVESNLRNALNVWIRWDDLGRPQDPDAILQLMGDAVEGDKGVDSVLGAWRQNAIESLTVDDILEHQLSGAKVDSFMRNIWGNFQEVTNDAWVAKYTGLDQGRFSSSRSATGPGKKTGIYVGINAATRKAADLLSKRTGEKWTPAEIQETVWSWAKSISEKADSTQTPITELITKLTNSEVSDTPDFGTLLSQPGEFHDILIGGGFNEQQLANLGGAAGAGSRAAVDPTGSSASAAGIQSRHLDAAAQRLESARRAERRPPVYDSLRQSVERSLAGEAAPAYRRRDRGDNRGYIGATYELPKERQGTLNSLGHSTPPVVELRQGNLQAANKFHKAISESAASHPSGAQVWVYTPEEYAGMRLFQTEDGKAGFALKPDGDIVSVFNHKNSKHRGITPNLLMLAIEQGGRKLDAFDTYLPHLYEQFGFREVSREPWNEAFKPDGWDKDVYRKYNNGEPDVVYMEYEPTKGVGEEAAEIAAQAAPRSAGDYGSTEFMSRVLRGDPLAGGRASVLEGVDLSRFDERLRNTVKQIKQ